MARKKRKKERKKEKARRKEGEKEGKKVMTTTLCDLQSPSAQLRRVTLYS